MNLEEVKKTVAAKKKHKVTPITTQMSWWLSNSRPFIINDEYEIVLDGYIKSKGARIIVRKLNKSEEENSATLTKSSLEEIL